MFGKTVGKACGDDALRKMYTKFLESTSIKSKKKLHLARKTIPTHLEEMGVTMDEIGAIGHWASTVQREVYSAKIPKSAVTALAGFYVGEAYHVPWATVAVPDELQTQLFPFAERVLVELKGKACVNQGLVNFVELLQQLRPFFWRASAAIHEKFPDSPLFSRMPVFKSSLASEFISQWPHARKEVEAQFQVDTEIAANFKEVATQSAFLSLSTSQRELSETVKLSHSLLEVLARRTEPLSPSRSVKTHVAIVSSRSATPSPTGPHSNFSSPQPPSIQTMVASASTPLQAATAASPSQISPTLPLPKSQSIMLLPPVVDPEVLSTQSRYVVSVNHKGSKYHVLRLSPGPLAPPTPFDIILPPAAAFASDQTTVTAYPGFSASSCGWQALFSVVVHPDFLWDCWGPGNLGEFPDVGSLWKCWDEGTAIEGVGRKPPLRMVETEWGSRKDKRSNKGHHAAWRPRQNTTARQKWSQFQFFISRIETSISTGLTASQAVQVLEDTRLTLSMPQLHRKLQTKRQKKGKVNGPSPESSAPSSGNIIMAT